MALLRGQLFAGALFAGLLVGGQGEQVPVTPEIPSSGGGISRGIQQYNLAKHVKLSGNTWQEQDTYGYAGIKYDLIAQHKVFALGKTGQEHVSLGHITSTNLVNVYKTDRLVSAHYHLNVATAQKQVSIGTVSVSNAPVVKDYLTTEIPNLVIGLQETSQVQQSFGTIISKQPIAEVELVSTHYHANAITAQVQESSGSVTVTQYLQTPITVSVKAATYQQQVSFGKVTTDDDEMLMVLMALLELDSDIG